MKHEKYDYSGYCGEQDGEPLTSSEYIIFWAALAIGVSAWSFAFFAVGYSMGMG